jgi:methylmalonyl-CoA/ethylmalonyl-CoA epimerase
MTFAEVYVQYPTWGRVDRDRNFNVQKHNKRIMHKIDHIGIAVRDMQAANELFAKLLGTEHYKVETVESEQVATSFFQVGESKIELLEATGPDSPIAKFIEKRGEGIHHLAFEVEDIVASMAQMAEQGFTLLQTAPKRGADNKLVAFLHPKSTNGVLIELCQSIK